MGKKFRKKNRIKSCVSPVKERNKIRDSILQVFKARLQSPGKGGALLVGKAVDSPLFLANNPNKKLQKLYSSSSSDIGSDSSDYLMAKKKKVKCKRKTTKENSSKTFDNPIKKHIKRLNEMDNSLPTPGTSSEKYPEQKISLITQSRVTKCLGLFNRGRKSDRIARAPISMSESVQNKTNEDLKRVLNIKNTNDNDYSEEDGENYSNMAPKKSSPLTIIKQNTREASPKRNPCQSNQKISSVSILQESQSSASCITVSSNISSGSELKENLPKNPPIKEIAVEMLSNLQQKQVLFNRNIRKERYNELQRLLMQSLLSSSPCSPVEKTKPAAMISAKRSLIKTTSLASKGSLKADSKKETEIDEKQLNLSGFNDAKSLLIQNDILLKLDENLQRKSASTGKSPESVDIVQNLDNSRSQHSALESVTVPTLSENQPIDHAGDYAPLNTDKLKLMTCKKFFNCQQTEQNKQHVASCIIVANEPLFRETCKSVPGFSGDCVDAMESTITKKQIYQTTQDSLDFLEYLDQSNTTDASSSFWDSHKKFYTWNKTAFKDTSSDSDNSPLWVPLSNLPPPPTKPCLDAIPSPPEKLYPRKLY